MNEKSEDDLYEKIVYVKKKKTYTLKDVRIMFNKFLKGECVELPLRVMRQIINKHDVKEFNDIKRYKIEDVNVIKKIKLTPEEKKERLLDYYKRKKAEDPEYFRKSARKFYQNNKELCKKRSVESFKKRRQHEKMMEEQSKIEEKVENDS